jgi:protein-glutamine gamma-glutamyltransferase
MIFVGGNQIGALPEAGGFEPNALRKSIFGIMLASPATYRYDDAGQLLFELRLRDASSRRPRSGAQRHDLPGFSGIRGRSRFLAADRRGRLPAARRRSPLQSRPGYYANGSDYGTECATAMVIVYYGAMLNVLPRRFSTGRMRTCI